MDVPPPLPLLRSPRLWGGLIIGLVVGLGLGLAAGFAIPGFDPDGTIKRMQAKKAEQIAAAQAVPAKDDDKKKPTHYPVETGVVLRRAALRRIEANGSVEAFETVRVAARVGGVIERVLVAEGDRVGAGQVLAEIEPKRYRLALYRAQSALDSARSRLADTEATLRRRTAAEQATPGTVSPEELASQRLRVDQAAADLSGAVAARDQAALDLDDAQVKAPMAGIVQTRDVQTGASIMSGAPVATLVQREPLQVRFLISVEQGALLTTGQPISVTVPGLNGTFTAAIHLIAASADRATRQVTVLARFADGAGAVRPGSFATIAIEAGGGPDELVVPELAVRPSERGFLLFTVVGDGDATTVREHRVELAGRSLDGLLAIRGEVKPGERIVVRGAEALRDGFLVRIETPGATP